MRRIEKAIKIKEQLDELFPEPPIPLDHKDPFTLLVAVVLSAQSTDKKVNEITPALFAKGPDPVAMANLSVAEIAELIRYIGLAPQKSRAIHGLSQILRDDYDSVVPEDFEALQTLPGVGRKTAAVVMAQAFGHPAFPVDTHIHRLAARWGLSKARNVLQTEMDLKKVFPRDSWNRLHLQIIYFGRAYCPARFHDLSQCPICGWAASKKRVAMEASASTKKG